MHSIRSGKGAHEVFLYKHPGHLKPCILLTLQIKEFHEKHYRLDNMVIVISGRMMPGELTSCILPIEDAYMQKVQSMSSRRTHELTSYYR